jgi:hypothetical protein
MRKVLAVLLYLAIIGAGAWLIGGWIEEGGRKIIALLVGLRMPDRTGPAPPASAKRTSAKRKGTG